LEDIINKDYDETSLLALHIIAILIAFDANYHSWSSSPHFAACRCFWPELKEIRENIYTAASVFLFQQIYSIGNKFTKILDVCFNRELYRFFFD
jgi:hypothetical protein